MFASELVELLNDNGIHTYIDIGECVRGGFHASLFRGEVKEGPILSSATGFGDTKNEAVRNYFDNIEGKRVAFNVGTPQRREFVMPRTILMDVCKCCGKEKIYGV